MIDVAEFERHRLYDPSAENAAERLAVLRWLEARGIGLTDMVAAQTRGRLLGLAGDRVIRPGERFDLQELLRRTGLAAEELDVLRRASGIPPPDPGAAVFTDADVVTFRAFRGAAEMFGTRAMLGFTRTIGNAMARVADAAVTLFVINVEQPLVARRASEVAIAEANARACQMLDGVPRLLEGLLRVHVEEAIWRSHNARAGVAERGTGRFAVGFVDLVGFTALSQQLAPAALGALIEDFEGEALDIVADRGGRVVKLIGDEVMFVTPSAAIACDVALALGESFRQHAGVTPRGGAAVGMLLMRGGDYYGPVVNVASRLADVAIPHEVLVTAEVADDATRDGAPFAFEHAGRRMLKGFADPVATRSVSRLA